MSELLLILGNKNYSSWSLRPWIALKVAGIAFEEKVIPMRSEAWEAAIPDLSPNRKVPVLNTPTGAIWESLAILEYLADTRPDARLWPPDIDQRGLARCYASEMHSGFAALRAALPMNCRMLFKPGPPSQEVAKDIDRIAEIWRSCRNAAPGKGDFLFGPFGAVDAMFAPVVSRFRTYGVTLDTVCESYMAAVMALPAMQEWYEASRAEPWTLDYDKLGEPL